MALGCVSNCIILNLNIYKNHKVLNAGNTRNMVQKLSHFASHRLRKKETKIIGVENLVTSKYARTLRLNRPFMYNVLLKPIRVNIVAVKKP